MADKTRKLAHTAAELDAAVDMLLEVYTRDEIDNIVTQKVSSETVSRQEEDSRLSEETALNRSTLGYQRKNLLKNIATSQSKNGVTFTVNEDKTVTVSATEADETTTLELNKNLKLPKGRYILSGGNNSSTEVRLYLNGQAKLIDVKSIVTLIMTVVFACLSAKGKVTSDQFITIFTTVIAFYFGTQYQKNSKEEE